MGGRMSPTRNARLCNPNSIGTKIRYCGIFKLVLFAVPARVAAVVHVVDRMPITVN